MPRSKLTAKPVQPGSKPVYVIPPDAGAVPNAGNGKEAQTSEGGEQTSSLAQQEPASILAEQEQDSSLAEQVAQAASKTGNGKEAQTSGDERQEKQADQEEESSESSEDEDAPAPPKTSPKKKPAVSKSVSKDKKKRKKSPWASKPSKNQYKLPLTQHQIYLKKLKDDIGPALFKKWKDDSAQKDRDDKNGGRPAYKYKTPKQLWATLEALKAAHAQNAPQDEEEGSDAEGQGQASSSSNGAAKK